MKLASGFCIPEPLPVHTGIKGRQVHPLIRFYAEEPRRVPVNQRWFKIVAWGHNVSVPSIREQGLRTVRLVPMCLPPPPLEDKRPHWGNPQSCLLHMSSRTQHTGGIHKAVSCICNSNIQGCSTLGDPHPVLTVSSFPPPLTTENSLKNPCNVICTNK